MKRHNLIFMVSLAGALALVMSCLSVSLAPFSAAQTLRLGFIGDSSTDEYRGSDNRGGSYSDVTLNWMELLVKYRNISAGEWGQWPEPRRVGYEYNWSRSAATTSTLLQQGQHAGMAEQIADGLVDMVIVNIGINDFAFFDGTYAAIYNGEIAGEALDSKIEQIIADYTTAVDTLLAAGDVPVIVTTIGDQSTSPGVLTNPQYADAAKRQIVTDAIRRTNAGIIRMADERGLKYFDSDDLLASLQTQLQTGLDIGGVSVNFLGAGDEPHNGVLSDGIHAGTLLESIIANKYLSLINELVEPDIPLLTDEEVLQAAGLMP